MNTSVRLVRILVIATVLTALVVSPVIAAAQEVGIVDGSVTSEPYGTFNGTAYVKHNGRFEGTTDGAYSVPFEIVAPADPTQGNGIVVVEPFRPPGMSGGLGAYLTPEFLFERGFSHAGIGWHPDDASPDEGYSIEEAIEILYNFGTALKEDEGVAHGMVGEVEKLYGTGVSLAAEPLMSLLASQETTVLDFSFLFVPSWEVGAYTQHPSSNNIMVFLTEWDLVDSARLSLHTDALRGSSPTYRSYEVAGGPHIPDVPWIRALEWGSEGTTPLDWTPVARALFLAGHHWTTEGVEPPPSAYLAEAPQGEIDAVYQAEYELELETGVARDENANALGGIRLPDLEIGRGQYIAMDPASMFGFGLFGAFKDLACEPLPDGSARFQDHAAYVSQFTQQVETLAEQGFLLPEDAEDLIATATASNVGEAAACAPAQLPASGQAAGDANFNWLLAGLILIAAGLILRQRAQACR